MKFGVDCRTRLLGCSLPFRAGHIEAHKACPPPSECQDQTCCVAQSGVCLGRQASGAFSWDYFHQFSCTPPSRSPSGDCPTLGANSGLLSDLLRRPRGPGAMDCQGWEVIGIHTKKKRNRGLEVERVEPPTSSYCDGCIIKSEGIPIC